MKLSRTVTYALQATLLLAQEERGEPIPCSRLAAEGAMPERFLLQILRSLVTHGILQSTRGVEGGYMLDRRPEEISLLEIIAPICATFTPASDPRITRSATIATTYRTIRAPAAISLPKHRGRCDGQLTVLFRVTASASRGRSSPSCSCRGAFPVRRCSRDSR